MGNSSRTWNVLQKEGPTTGGAFVGKDCCEVAEAKVQASTVELPRPSFADNSGKTSASFGSSVSIGMDSNAGWASVSLGLSPEKSPDSGRVLGLWNVIVASQRAQNRTAKEVLDAELTAKHMTRPLRSNEYTGMRVSGETRRWKLDDKDLPALSFLEERFDRLEAGDYHVEALSKVISRDEDLDPGIQSFFDATGKLQLRKGGVAVPLPANPEQLRSRIKIWGIALQMIGMKNAIHTAFQDWTPQHTENYLSYLLGEFCLGLIGRSATGETVAAPSGAQRSMYEQQIRKGCHKLMMEEGVAAPAAPLQAWIDPEIKERHFTTPTALSGVARKPFDSYSQGSGKGGGKGGAGKNKKHNNGPYGGKGGKGEGKGGKFGKGGKGGAGKSGKGGKVGGGKLGVCFSFNNHWEMCTRSNCKFAHVCSIGGGKHPVYKCSNNSGPASETQGQGHVPNVAE